MAEVRSSEFSLYRNNLVDAHMAMKAWLWDTGPNEPDFPEAPEPPEGKEGEPKFDLAKLQYRRKLKAYEDALLDYEQRQKEFKDWFARNGGPVEILFWSVDAIDALKWDLKAVFDRRQEKPRYYVSRRNNKLLIDRLVSAMTEILNREKIELEVSTGLPKGMKPGHGQKANLERQIAGEKEFVEALRADPQFGQEMRP